MRKSLLFLYIVTVLLIAGLARAESLSSLPISKANYDSSTHLLLVEGIIPNTCFKEALPVLTASAEQGAAVLNVVTPTDGQPCLQMVQGNYILAFDLRSLISESDLNMASVDQIFVETEDGLEHISVGLRMEKFAFPVASDQIVGELIELKAGGYGVVDSTGFINCLQNPKINWAAFVGQQVQVIGHQLAHGLQLFDFGPDTEGGLFLAVGVAPQLN